MCAKAWNNTGYGRWLRAAEPGEYREGQRARPFIHTAEACVMMAVPMPFPAALPARLGPAARVEGAALRATNTAARAEQQVAVRQTNRAAQTERAAPASVRYGPHMEDPLPPRIANSFRGGSYTQTTLQSEVTLYRVYGGKAGELASWWSRTPPSGPMQAKMDLALLPEWGNSAQRVATIRVPKGTVIYEGAAAPQGYLLGGGNQVFIPYGNPAWVVRL